ncbi:unnamed protein product [Paramecium octaurelia]|uniref:Palmitoyltransferase n=1 Tax=Paramecium octaurelia TaxID=43137 RepID=A0A8S1W7Y0_PAROT|nr:unnamed protein product [Paramecium octaurelia]
MIPSSDHNQRRKKRAQLKHQAGPFIIFFTVLMPTNCVILEQFYFDLKMDPTTQLINGILVYLSYSMAMWSYYQSITIKNYTIDKTIPIQDNRRIDPLYKNTNSCNECNKWKPIRTHHCSLCGKCILKMDHHCPWIHNCVGLRNHRSFYLFSMYMTIGAIQYSYASWVYFRFLFRSSEGFFAHQSTFFYIYWSLTSLVLYPTCAMLCFLFFYHTSLILNNQTTLEQMRSGSNGNCCIKSDRPPRNINLFDRGTLSNIAWFFNYSYFWFLPFENIYKEDGTKYPISPLCNLQDIKISNPSIPLVQIPEQQFDFDKIDQKYEEYLAFAKQKYKNKRLVLIGKEIQLN